MLKAFAATLLIFSSIAQADSKTYTIKGMDCGDCVKNIEAKVCTLPGMDSCKVEVGQVTLVSKKPLDDTQISKAVKGAGHYSVTGSKAISEPPTSK